MKTKFYPLLLILLILSCKNETNKEFNKNTKTTKTKNDHYTVASKAHNSKNSLDYHGIYKGTIPCADCEGIKTAIALAKDGSYVRTIQYLGKEIGGTQSSGTYSWNSKGSVIKIVFTSGETQLYQVGENVLFHLDRDGNKIESNLADRYKLLKSEEK